VQKQPFISLKKTQQTMQHVTLQHQFKVTMNGYVKIYAEVN